MTGFSRQLLIAAGANLPFREQPPQVTLRQAFDALRRAGLTDLAVSAFYKTPCFPAGAGPDYVNAAATARLPEGKSPQDVLALFHRIEAEFGRERETRWGMRTLDLDLIACGDAVLPDRHRYAAWAGLPLDRQMAEAPEQLILPHPRMQDRAFVLVPLADVAAEWVHPVTGQSVADMLERLPHADKAEVVRLDA